MPVICTVYFLVELPDEMWKPQHIFIVSSKKPPPKNGEYLPSIFLFLGKVGIGGQRKKEEDKKGE